MEPTHTQTSGAEALHILDTSYDHTCSAVVPLTTGLFLSFVFHFPSRMFEPACATSHGLPFIHRNISSSGRSRINALPSNESFFRNVRTPRQWKPLGHSRTTPCRNSMRGNQTSRLYVNGGIAALLAPLLPPPFSHPLYPRRPTINTIGRKWLGSQMTLRLFCPRPPSPPSMLQTLSATAAGCGLRP